MTPSVTPVARSHADDQQTGLRRLVSEHGALLPSADVEEPHQADGRRGRWKLQAQRLLT